MNKLLSANFTRLWRSKLFWLCTIGMLIFSAGFMLNGCRQAGRLMAEYNLVLDEYYFAIMPTIGILCAVFAGLFLGTEYSDGGIRNKLVVGHTRTAVYVSSWITAFAATLLMTAAWLAGGLVGIPTLGIWEMGVPGLMTHVMICVLLAAAFSAIFTFVGMMSDSKAITAVVCILLFLGLLLCASMIDNRLSEPEMASGIIVTADGMQMADPKPNPNYLSGNLRKVYEFLRDFLPTGQSIMIANLEAANFLRMALSSVFITVLVTLGGICLFRRKDLK